MQRRNVPTPFRNGGVGRGVFNPHSSVRNNDPHRGRPSLFCSSRMLLFVAVSLTIVNYMYPVQLQKVEHEMMQGAVEAEHIIEQEMMDWWASADINGHHKPPSGENYHRNTAEIQRAASERMGQQESKWVDGEKRLKQELKKLVALQQQGKELGVPVLTRWVGADIPAWAGEGVDKDEWNAKVKARYDEMREEENRWREMVEATIKAEKRG